MTRTILGNRRAVAVAFSLLVAGCSGNSSGIAGSGSGTSSGGAPSGTSSGDDSSSGAGSSDSGSGPSSGSGSGNGPNDGGGTSSGPVGSGGDEDATVGPDAASPKGGGAHDAAAHDGSTRDAATPATGDGGDALAAARAQCVQIINQDRATLSPASPPLEEDTAEEACVDGQAQADYQANTAHSAFGNCRESAQDECPNWPGPPSSIMTNCLAQMWAEGPPAAGQDNHWLNMSNAKYKKVACGFYQTPTGKWWATQDFF
jgi:hypothetical protein